MLSSHIINSIIGDCSLKKLVNRGTPQGGPLLWLLVINSILLKLKKLGFTVVEYTDDLVILVSGMFPTVLSDRMKLVLDSLWEWTDCCGLDINPKTDLVLFRQGYKIPDFKPPIKGTVLELKEQAKFLGVILDTGFTWKKNLEERIKKAQVAYFAFCKAFGKTWGLSPKLLYWIFTAVVRPILMYGTSVW